MKIKLINVPSLYPDFTPYVTKYGDNGLTAMAIIVLDGNTATIDSLLMSCRIIGRNIEKVIMNNLIQWMIDHEIKEIISEYIPTKKNMQVSEDLFNSKLLSERDYLSSKIDFKKNSNLSEMATEIRERMNKSAEGKPAVNIYDTKDNAARLAQATAR